MCSVSSTYLSGIVDPLQSHVTENHGQQVRDRTDSVVRRLRRVGALFGKRFEHKPRERIVDHALHEHQRQRVRELFALRAVRAPGDLLLEYPVEEVAHEYAGGADSELGTLVHGSSTAGCRVLRQARKTIFS